MKIWPSEISMVCVSFFDSVNAEDWLLLTVDVFQDGSILRVFLIGHAHKDLVTLGGQRQLGSPIQVTCNRRTLKEHIQENPLTFVEWKVKVARKVIGLGGNAYLLCLFILIFEERNLDNVLIQRLILIGL